MKQQLNVASQHHKSKTDKQLRSIKNVTNDAQTRYIYEQRGLTKIIV